MTMSEMSDRTSGFVQDLGDAVKQNPVSAALIGMGVMWLFASRGRPFGTAPSLRGIADAAQDVWQGASSNLQAASGGVQNGISSMSNRVREQAASVSNTIGESGSRLASNVADRAGEFPGAVTGALGDARESLAEMFRSQPLALGAVGLAIGAAVAASLPMTDVESEYFGETSDMVKDQMSEMAGEKAQQAADIGRKVYEAVVDEAQQQGLTVDNLKSTASEMSDKVTRLGSAVRPPRE
jgi:hypothetical protein